MSLGPVIIDIEGTALTSDDKNLLAHPLVGGVIYFSRNYSSPEQIAALSKDIRQCRPDILIAVDQEGGRVQRFKEGFTRLPAMQRFLPLFRKNSQAALALVENCGWLMAVELLSVGVDISFSPVLDVDDKQCDVIADRSFSPKPEEVTLLAGAWMRGMRDAGMATTGKHFPGHGSVVGDSHLVSPIDNRSWDEICHHDLIPFADLLPQLQAVMPAHVIFPNVDKHPVGFSSHWLQNVLRQKLAFDGVVFSDDLTMEGAAVAGSYGDRAISALEAGCDMVLVCNNREGALSTLGTLENYQSLTHVEQSRERIMKMKALKRWSVSALKTNSRYIKTAAILNAMTTGTAS
ncbi:beta-N-acetylhexosaminidase [Eionea flava]